MTWKRAPRARGAPRSTGADAHPGRKGIVLVLAADHGKVREYEYDLVTGSETNAADKTASAR